MSLEIVRASFFLSKLFTFSLRRQTFLIAFEEKKFGGMRLAYYVYGPLFWESTLLLSVPERRLRKAEK